MYYALFSIEISQAFYFIKVSSASTERTFGNIGSYQDAHREHAAESVIKCFLAII